MTQAEWERQKAIAIPHLERLKKIAAPSVGKLHNRDRRALQKAANFHNFWES